MVSSTSTGRQDGETVFRPVSPLSGTIGTSTDTPTRQNSDRLLFRPIHSMCTPSRFTAQPPREPPDNPTGCPRQRSRKCGPHSRSAAA